MENHQLEIKNQRKSDDDTLENWKCQNKSIRHEGDKRQLKAKDANNNNK